MPTKNQPLIEKRTQHLRRAINDLLLYRDGQVEHAKFWANVGSGIVCWWMVTMPPLVWREWIASIAIASSLIAPDIVKKIIALKAKSGQLAAK